MIKDVNDFFFFFYISLLLCDLVSSRGLAGRGYILILFLKNLNFPGLFIVRILKRLKPQDF